MLLAVSRPTELFEPLEQVIEILEDRVSNRQKIYGQRLVLSTIVYLSMKFVSYFAKCKGSMVKDLVHKILLKTRL